jgi:iron complex transport system permease protein
MLISGSSLTQILYWLNGGLSGRGWNEFISAMPFALLGMIISMIVSKDLNVMNFGEEMSSSLGLDVKKFQRMAILASSLLAAAAVSVAGIVSFAGLIVPNLTRLLIGNDYRFSVPCSILMGASFMLISDTIARTITAPAEIPLGIVTSFIGAPVFIWLMIKGNAGKLRA